jgi:MOSC domain-containing protein YiiM
MMRQEARTAMTSPSIASVNVGRPQTRGYDGAADPFDQPWTSGIFKTAVAGAVWLTPTGFDGDGQADLTVHGCEDKAACVYSADHYPAWSRELHRHPLAFGAFGENLSVAGLDEQSVCIGDVWAIGEAVVEVSQPRQPCWKLARRWRITTFSDQVVKSGRTGWYFRVRTPGLVAQGTALSLVARPHPEWTVAAANAVMHQRVGDTAALASLAPLSASWRATLRRRLAV